MKGPIPALLVVVSITLLAGCGDEEVRGFEDAGLPRDQCLSATDMEIVLASRIDAGVGVDAGYPNPKIDAYWCSYDPECFPLFIAEMDEEGLACAHACMENTPSAGLSLGCLDCFVNEARDCAADLCLNDCLGDINACEACFAIQCQDRLDLCIGY